MSLKDHKIPKNYIKAKIVFDNYNNGGVGTTK
jgi:hypothetical protein